jgi:hypothetical protein
VAHHERENGDLREEVVVPAAHPPAAAPAFAAQVLSLQRTAGNHAVTALLARQHHPGDAAAPPLPRPGEQPQHRAAFDAYIAEAVKSSKVDDLRAARRASDGPVVDEKTITLNGVQLVVDQENLTAVLTRIRWRAMDVIHDRFTAARKGEASATDEADRRKARMAVLPEVKPYIEFLRDDPIADKRSAMDRFQHWYDKAQESVQSVLGLMAVAEAENAMSGQFDEGAGKSTRKAQSYAETGLAEGQEWCGAFAGMSSMHVGLDSFLKTYTWGTGRYANLFTYASSKPAGVAPHWAWDGADWVTVKDLHLARNSPRRWIQPEGKKPWELDLRPGDIVLVDNKDGGAQDFGPDHVQMVHSFHPDPAGKKATLFTIGGNEASLILDDHEPQTDKEKARGHGLKSTASSFSHVGIDDRDLTKEAPTKEQKGEGRFNKSRVFAFGRFSVVDYENHFYTPGFEKPKKPPAGA